MCSAALCTSIAEELFIISRLSRPAGRSKRIFTRGVVEGNGRCSAAFCESVALRERLLQAFSGLNPLRRSRASSPEGGAFGHLPVSTNKAPPFGGAGIAQR